MRIFFVLVLIFTFTSCDKIPFLKKQETLQLDTIVDFTSVDVSPSFTECDSLVQKQQKSDCFRTTIHQKIGKELQAFHLKSQDSINEKIWLDLVINSQGVIHIDYIKASSTLKYQLPELDSVLQFSVQKLPKIYPAIKRGIPVTTKYQLPIQIKLQE